MDSFVHLAADIRLRLERGLGKTLTSLQQGIVQEVCRFAALGRGHRWRGLFAFGAAFAVRDGPVEDNSVMPVACALELVHAASLILDDLPSMDDAEMRRGKPCAHRIFPVWAVELGSVFLVNLAQRVLLSNSNRTPELRIATAYELSKAIQLMIYGQEQDLTQLPAHTGSDFVRDCYTFKTGSLWGAAAKMAALDCGCDATTAEQLYNCGLNTGICYQVLDDIADATSTFEATGKTLRSDGSKITSVTLYGVQGARALSEECRGKAMSFIECHGSEADFLRFLIGQICCDEGPLSR
jgi:geranylgeranyl diphosphate synthase type II